MEVSDLINREKLKQILSKGNVYNRTIPGFYDLIFKTGQEEI